MTTLSAAYTQACPLYARAKRLGARNGEAFSVQPKTADRIMLALAIAAVVGGVVASISGAI